MNGSSLVKEIGRSFIVSSFFPSVLFVFVLVLLFQGFFPVDIINQFSSLETLFVVLGTSFTVITIWISLLLYSSVDWVVSLYEGVYFPPLVREILRFFLWKKVRRDFEIYLITREILEKAIGERTHEDHEHYEDIWQMAMWELAYSGWLAPSDEDNVMPTRLGNILRASSEYASVLLAKFCNKFETCQWHLGCDFKLGFNAMSGCMIFNSLHYLSNRPLV